MYFWWNIKKCRSIVGSWRSFCIGRVFWYSVRLGSVLGMWNATRFGPRFVPKLSIRFMSTFLFSWTVNLSSDVEDKLKIYRENFEKAYLNAAEEFYKQNAHEYLSKNGVQNYMRYADQKLKEEEDRARRYLETGYGCQSVAAVSIFLSLSSSLLSLSLSLSVSLSLSLLCQKFERGGG